MPTHSKEITERYAKGKRYSKAATILMRKNNSERWVAKSVTKYGTRFNYDKAKKQFQTQKKPKVSINCSVHNHEFTITPDEHIQLKFGGCNHCKRDGLAAASNIKNEKRFKDWFEKNRGNRLEIISAFKGMTEPVTFRCKIHATEEDYLPTNLMSPSTNSWGCSKCASEASGIAKRLNIDELSKEIKDSLPEGVKIHNIEFNEEVKGTRIILDCELHGIQVPVGYTQFKNSKHKCADCGREQRGYTSARLRKLIESEEKGESCRVAVMEIEVNSP